MADKANGVQPVAWLKRNGRVFVDSAHTVRTHAERSAENDKGAEVVPLVLASDYEHLEAKLEAAERDAARWRWTSQRAWFVDAGAYAFDLRFGPGDFSTEPRNADADDVQQAIDEAMAEDSELDTAIDAAIDAQRQEGK